MDGHYKRAPFADNATKIVTMASPFSSEMQHRRHREGEAKRVGTEFCQTSFHIFIKCQDCSLVPELINSIEITILLLLTFLALLLLLRGFPNYCY